MQIIFSKIEIFIEQLYYTNHNNISNKNSKYKRLMYKLIVVHLSLKN